MSPWSILNHLAVCMSPWSILNHLAVCRAGGSNLTVVRPFPIKGGPGVLPWKILEKCCLLVHSGTI